MTSRRRTTRSTSTVDETRAPPQVESTGASILSGASSPSVLGGEIINSQGDHNRATLIQYINLGGSDSDTSRSTLAVSNPSTSGTVRHLPHASTSPTARDPPRSSTSSASNQEQSSLESNVSTDSGLGGSGVSSEIESSDSPPNEEEEDNLIEEEPSNAIYERHMYLKKHGFPLWIPQPNMRLSRSYRRQGVSIGDVGIFTWDGRFDFLFNVCLPAGHPNNPNELPEGFSCLELRSTDVSVVRAHSSPSHMTSTSVQKQVGPTFECSGSDGAVLTMPQGAYHEDLDNISRFRDYALTHAESWYQYANGPCGREIGNGELHMVTGCDKTTAWGIATYSHLQSNRPEGSVTLLSFEAVDNERHGRRPSYPTYAWDYKGTVDAKVGPEEDELLDLGVQGSALPRNQCTFIRSLTPAIGQDGWERLQLKLAASAEERASAQSPKNHFASVLGAISSLPRRISSLRGYGRGSTSKLTDSVTPAQALPAHPSTYVIDMILQKCPKAKVIVVHDNDWCSVIRDSDDNWTCTAQDLPCRIQEAFDVMEEENGIIYLQEKMRFSQRLSIPSLVSVTLEDEGRLLVEDRNSGPSHFHPRPKVDKWDDYPKLNERRHSGKGDDGKSSDEDKKPSHIFDHFKPSPSPSDMKVDSRKEEEEFKATEGPANEEEAPQALGRLREAPQVEQKLDSVGEPDERGRRRDRGRRSDSGKARVPVKGYNGANQDSFEEEEVVPMYWRAMSRSRSRISMDWRPTSRSRSRPPESTSFDQHGLTNNPYDIGIPFPPMGPHSSPDNSNQNDGQLCHHSTGTKRRAEMDPMELWLRADPWKMDGTYSPLAGNESSNLLLSTSNCWFSPYEGIPTTTSAGPLAQPTQYPSDLRPNLENSRYHSTQSSSSNMHQTSRSPPSAGEGSSAAAAAASAAMAGEYADAAVERSILDYPQLTDFDLYGSPYTHVDPTQILSVGQDDLMGPRSNASPESYGTLSASTPPSTEGPSNRQHAFQREYISLLQGAQDVTPMKRRRTFRSSWSYTSASASSSRGSSPSHASE